MTLRTHRYASLPLSDILNVKLLIRRWGKYPNSNIIELLMTEKDYMVESLTADLSERVALRYRTSIEDAMTAVYESETFSKLSDPRTGLYFQGSEYVFSFLEQELQKGRF